MYWLLAIIIMFIAYKTCCHAKGSQCAQPPVYQAPLLSAELQQALNQTRKPLIIPLD